MIHLIILIFMIEIWLPVIDYEGLYEVSNCGRVKSLDHIVYQVHNGGKLGPMKYKGKILKPGRDKGGYEICNLYKDGIMKSKTIHRLVAEAFIPNPKNLPQVNHKDENKLNNRVDNLEWCSVKYNINYGTCIQRRSISQGKRIKVDGIEYQSISEAERFLNCPKNALFQALIHNRTTYKNHKIELINDLSFH